MEETILIAVLVFWIVMNWILAASEGIKLTDICQEKCSVVNNTRDQRPKNVSSLSPLLFS